MHLLDCEECMHILDLYLLLQQHNEPMMNTTNNEAFLLDKDPTSAWVSCVAPMEQHCFSTPHSIHNHFVDGFIFDGMKVALSVAVAPTHSQLSLVETSHMYTLPDFITKLQEYNA